MASSSSSSSGAGQAAGRKCVSSARRWGGAKNAGASVECSLAWSAGANHNPFGVRLVAVCADGSSRRSEVSDAQQDGPVKLLWDSAPLGQYAFYVETVASGSDQLVLTLDTPFEVKVKIASDGLVSKSRLQVPDIRDGQVKRAFEVESRRSGKWSLYRSNRDTAAERKYDEARFVMRTVDDF